MSTNPPERRRTIVLLQMREPIDTEAYALRLKSEPMLIVRTDRRALTKPDLRLADKCCGQDDGVPTILVSRRGLRPDEPVCKCCERAPAGIRWPALIELVYAVLGRSPAPATLDSSADRIKRLTPRERDVLTMVGQGKTVEQCAEEMGVSPSTIGNHKYRLMRKLDARNSLQLLRIAVRNGLADFA